MVYAVDDCTLPFSFTHSANTGGSLLHEFAGVRVERRWLENGPQHSIEFSRNAKHH